VEFVQGEIEESNRLGLGVEAIEEIEEDWGWCRCGGIGYAEGNVEVEVEVEGLVVGGDHLSFTSYSL
jgi:hypothetical protein